MSGVLQVAVPVPLPQLFDYLPPAGVAVADVGIGARVVVPFGRGRRVGIVVAYALNSTVARAKLKAALAVLDPVPLIQAEWLESLQWVARYYQYPLGEVLHAALPVGMRSPRGLPDDGERALALSYTGNSTQTAPRSGSRAAMLLALLERGPMTPAALDIELPGWRSASANLRRRGLVMTTVIKRHAPLRGVIAGPPLTVDQAQAVEQISVRLGEFAPTLLEGITGSGKTEVYLQLIERVIARGQQALVLVPEIGLTPQAVQRFRERLAGRIELLHSGLADGERTRAWLAAARGEAQVVIGTRSAVFAPLPQAGIIIVDEEHDASYKQQEGLRYSAHDLALVRGKALGVPVILGSATPSLETLANVDAGRYRRLLLASRPGAARLPAMRCVDLRGKPLRHGLAAELITAVRTCVERGEQALVFRNRRGYAPVLMCHSCAWHATCARCDKPLTWHRGAARLRCHHCGADQPVPKQCPQCANPVLTPQGLGTERLQQTLSEIFPDVAVVRIDRETTRRRDSLDALLGQMKPDQAGILVGTQMLAKGHDLPNLTLVAVVGVDEGLFSVDFRAGERLAQLIVQVAGRAGRAHKPGHVLLQTHHPDHPLLRELLSHGYAKAAAGMLAERREAELPPYAHMALLRADASDQIQVEAFLAATVATAVPSAEVSLLGPLTAPMPRRAGLHRGQVLISAPIRSHLQAFLPPWLAQVRALREARRVRWSLDVDPVDLY